MEVIDGTWINRHLTGARGEKKRLADFIGIDTHKLAKILSGERKVQAEEIPKIMQFFGRTPDEATARLLAAWALLTPAERDFLLASAEAGAARHREAKQ